jgi:DNA end-binding protein Ku
MARPIWKGVISFGMVSVPVKLYGATQNKDIGFNQIHQECNSRIKQKRWCPVCDREVEQDEIVRGYQYEKDQYVILTDEDFEQLPVASKHTIDLSAFVKEREIDPVYYEKSYFLEPEQAGLKPYALLMRALDEKGVSAVAKIALHNKEHLCVLRPVDGVMMLETLFYPDEVRTSDRPHVPDVLVSKPELDMAYSLIDLLEEPFDPEKYEDQYRTALVDLVDAKKRGKTIVATPEEPVARTTDLMAALKASLDAAKKHKQPDKPAAANGKSGADTEQTATDIEAAAADGKAAAADESSADGKPARKGGKAAARTGARQRKAS